MGLRRRRPLMAGVMGGGLRRSLIAYWKLDETSGTRIDAVGVNDLADGNTVGATAGVIGSAAQFVAGNSEYLEVADGPLLRIGSGGATIVAWVKLADTAAIYTICSKWHNYEEFLLFYRLSDDRFRFQVSSDGVDRTAVNADSFGSLSADIWYFVVAWVDPVAQVIGIQINNGAQNTAACTLAINGGLDPWRIGAYGASASVNASMNGAIDEVGYWKRVLTAGERTTLYNGGAGLTYPFDSSGRARYVELFCVAGQSNAEGRGNSVQSPAASSTTAYEVTDGAIIALADPVGGAVTGSAWPAFANEFLLNFGGRIAISEQATGGSAQCVDADSGSGSWDSTGALLGDAITAINAAILRLGAAGYNVRFRGVLWSQGERDAQEIVDTGDIDKATYKTALQTMIAALRAEFDASMPFWIFQTGGKATAGNLTVEDATYASAFADIRAAQSEVAAADANTDIVFSGAYALIAGGKMSDALHYNQTGLNEMGAAGGEVVAAGI